jgi:hypothetical protein
MRQFLLLATATIMLAGCASQTKLMQRGDYDALINKTVNNLVKNPNSKEDAEMLDKAYTLANDRDQERARYLRIEGNPDTWDELLTLYSTMKNRQSLVRKVMPLHIGGRTVDYENVDYDSQIVEAKRKAAEYYYAHGKKVLETGTKESYRQAYYELSKARSYSGGSYLDLDKLLLETKYKGMSRVFIGVVNRTIINLPEEFMNGLIAVNANEMNSEWVEVYTRDYNEDLNYDYYVNIILQNVNVTPDLARDTDGIEKKTIEDGFEYVLDARGNVMKDTAGNDIRIKKYKDIQCTVIETKQTKDCQINGEVEFISAYPSQSLLKRQPIAAGTHFEHVSARAIGDVNALSDEKKALVAVKPLPFPSDIQMIIDCTEALKGSIYEAVRYNRGLMQ